MLLDMAETTRSTTSRSAAPSTSAATPWPTVDIQQMTGTVWNRLSPPHEEPEDHEPCHLSTSATQWLTEYVSAYALLTRVFKANAQAKSELLLRDLGSHESAFLFAGTASATPRRNASETGVQAVTGYNYFELMAFTQPAPPDRYPLLRAALDAGRIEGAGLPAPGRRALRIVEEDDVALVDEQVRFGTAGRPPADHARRRRLR